MTPDIPINDEIRSKVKKFAEENKISLEGAYKRIINAGLTVYDQVKATTPTKDDIDKVLNLKKRQ